MKKHNIKDFLLIIVAALAGAFLLCLTLTYRSFFTNSTFRKNMQGPESTQTITKYFNDALDDSLQGMGLSYSEKTDLYYSEDDTGKLLRPTMANIINSKQKYFFEPGVFASVAIVNYRKSRLFSSQTPSERTDFERRYEKNIYSVFITRSREEKESLLFVRFHRFKSAWLPVTLACLFIFCGLNIWTYIRRDHWVFFKYLNISVTLSGAFTFIFAYLLNTVSGSVIDSSVSAEIRPLCHSYLNIVDNIIWMAGFLTATFGMTVAILAMGVFQKRKTK